MDLSVAIRMEQHPIVGGIFPSIHAPHKMVVVPSCELSDLLLTDWTKPFLFFPEGEQLPFPLEMVHHLDAEAFFEVLFPSGVVGVRFSLNFHMSFDGDICRVQETIFYQTIFGCDSPVEHPILSVAGFEVAFLNPLFGFVGVSSPRPSPQRLKDRMAGSGKGDFTHNMLVIVRPPSNEWVELNDQIACCCLFIGLDECPYLP